MPLPNLIDFETQECVSSEYSEVVIDLFCLVHI